MTSSPVFSKQTIEFVTVAAEFCAFIEKTNQYNKLLFIDKSIKLLPLLYLKALLLPEIDLEDNEHTQGFVTEEIYEYQRDTISKLLGADDDYLDVFIEDMVYSETALKSSISEDLCDIYQDIKDFLYIYSQGFEPTMNASLYNLKYNFGDFWSQKLVNCLRPLNQLKFSDNIQEEDEDNFANYNSSNNIFDSQKDGFDENSELDDWNAY